MARQLTEHSRRAIRTSLSLLLGLCLFVCARASGTQNETGASPRTSSPVPAAKFELPIGCRRYINPPNAITCTGGRSSAPQPFEIPAENANVQGITTFFAYGTPWHTLPLLANFTRLEQVTFYFNRRLRTVPATTFANLHQLTTMRIVANSIESFNQFTFHDLRRLKILDLSHNHLASLPPRLFANARSLLYLHLENNRIHSLPSTLLHSAEKLVHIDMSNNHLQELPGELFANNHRLIRIVLRKNALTRLPLSIFHNINKTSLIGSIDLRQNQLEFVPDALFQGFPINTGYDIRLYDNPLRCDCSGHWALSNDVHGRFITCRADNGSVLPALDHIKRCACSNGDSTRTILFPTPQRDTVQQGTAASLPGCVTELVALVPTPLTFHQCYRTGGVKSPTQDQSKIGQAEQSMQHSLEISPKGVTVMFRFRRDFDPQRVQSAGRQYLLAYGYHDDVMPLALAVSHRQLEVLLWEVGQRVITVITTTDNCNQSLAGVKDVTFSLHPSVRPGSESKAWSVTLHVNGRRCRLSKDLVSQPVLVQQADPAPSLGPTSAESLLHSQLPSAGMYPLSIGAALLSDNATRTNCFQGAVDLMYLLNRPLQDRTVANLFQETLPRIPGGIGDSASWCLQPTSTLPGSDECANNASVQPASTMICKGLKTAQSTPSASYTCTRLQLCNAGETGCEGQDSTEGGSTPPICPCQNGGICRNQNNSTMGVEPCDCPAGFHGSLCEHHVCLNCSVHPCKPGWTGASCEYDLDECHNMPCANLGTCHNLPGSFLCECITGYQGALCEKKLNSCIPGVCHPTEVCRSMLNTFECLCTGQSCMKTPAKPCTEADIAHCPRNSLCVGGVPSGNTTQNVCDCKPGYKGKDCLDDVDECTDDVIMRSCNADNGRCMNTHGSYTCECLYDQSSRTDTTSNATALPLQPGSNDSSASQTCNPHCSTSCRNGGACIATNRCACMPGFGGLTCSVPLCRTPCPPGAVCTGVETCATTTSPVSTAIATTAATVSTESELSSVHRPLTSVKQTTTKTRTEVTQPAERKPTVDQEPVGETTNRRPESPPSHQATSPVTVHNPTLTETRAALTSHPAPSVTSSAGSNNTSPGGIGPSSVDKKRRNLILVSGILGGVLFLLFLLAAVSVAHRKRQDKKREEDYLAAHAAMLGSRNMAGHQQSPTIETSAGDVHANSPALAREYMVTPTSDTTFTNSFHSADSLCSAGRGQTLQMTAPAGAMPPRARQDSNCLVLVHQPYMMKADTSAPMLPCSAPRKAGILDDMTRNRLSGPSEAFTSFDPDQPFAPVFADDDCQNGFPRSVSQHGVRSAETGQGADSGFSNGEVATATTSRSSTHQSMAWDNLEGLVELSIDSPQYQI